MPAFSVRPFRAALIGAALIATANANGAIAQITAPSDLRASDMPRVLIERRVAPGVLARQGYMGLAMSDDRRTLATGGIFADQARASVEAMMACRNQSGQSCYTMLTVRDACIGWAVAPDGRAISVQASTGAEAQQQALNQCNRAAGLFVGCRSGSVCTPGRN